MEIESRAVSVGRLPKVQRMHQIWRANSVLVFCLKTQQEITALTGGAHAAARWVVDDHWLLFEKMLADITP